MEGAKACPLFSRKEWDGIILSSKNQKESGSDRIYKLVSYHRVISRGKEDLELPFAFRPLHDRESARKESRPAVAIRVGGGLSPR